MNMKCAKVLWHMEKEVLFRDEDDSQYFAP